MNLFFQGRPCRALLGLMLLLFVTTSQAMAAESGPAVSTPSAPADNRPLAGGSQTLAQLIEFALAHNPEIAASALDGRGAAARARAALGARLPRLSAEGGYTRYYADDLRLTGARYNGEPGVFGDNILTTDLILRLPLYAGGRLVAEMRAAELLEASAGQRLARSKEELIYNITSLYFNQLAQRQLIESLDFSASVLSGQLKRAGALIAERKAAKVDALRTEVKLADLNQRLLREKNNLHVQRRALLNLMGASGTADDFSLAGTLEQPADEKRPHAKLAAAALERRPDVLAFKKELAAQGARLEAARAGHLPTVNLIGAIGNRLMASPSQHPAGLDKNDDTGRVAITLELPLFDGGRTSARVEEENVRLAAQRQRLRKLQLQIDLEIETAQANLSSAQERIAGADKAVALAQESLRIEEEKYALARGTAQEVLDAQSALLEAQTNRIRALADANTATAQLALATGENLP